MKRIEMILKGVSAVIVVTIVVIIGISFHSVFNGLTSKDFIGTPGVSVSAIERQAKSQRLVLVLFKDGCPWCQATRPVLTKVKESGNIADQARIVYANVEDNEGKLLAQKYKVSSAPGLVLLARGGQQVTQLDYNGKTYHYPGTDELVSPQNGVTNVNSPDQVNVNEDYLQAAINTEWGEN
jgi:Thioredoxin-related protein